MRYVSPAIRPRPLSEMPIAVGCQAIAAASNAKLVGKTEKKQAKAGEALDKSRAKTHKMFAKFEAFVRESNEEQRSHYTRDLPSICASYEMLGAGAFVVVSKPSDSATCLLRFCRAAAVGGGQPPDDRAHSPAGRNGR